MKASVLVLAAALLSLSACSHKPTRSTREVSRASGTTTTTAPAVSPTVPDEGGTVSGAPASLGSGSSGRGH